MGKLTTTTFVVVCLTMATVMTIVSALSSSSLLSSAQSLSIAASGGGTATLKRQLGSSSRFIRENAIEQRRRRLLPPILSHSSPLQRTPIMTTSTMLSAAYDVQVTSSPHRHHEQLEHQHRNDYYRTSAIGNDINEVQVFGRGGAFFGDYGFVAALLANFEEMDDAANNNNKEEATSTATGSMAMIDVDSSSLSVVSSTSTAVAAVTVVEDNVVAETFKVAETVNSIHRDEGGGAIIGATVASPPSSSSSSSSSSLSTSGTAKTAVISDNEKAQGGTEGATTTTMKASTTATDTIATKVDTPIVEGNANGVIKKVGGDKSDTSMIVEEDDVVQTRMMEKKEKVVNDFIATELAKDTQQRNNDKVRLNDDRDTEMQEMEERKLRMRRLADDRLAADIAEGKVRQEREALDKLVAIRDARQSTIDALRLAIDKAMREQMKMSKDESLRQTELETVLENAERAQILSLEKVRILRLDMKLARVEAIALEERIETIRDSMRKLEVEQEGTRSMLEEMMKTTTKTTTMPPTTKKSTTSMMKSSTPIISRTSKSNVKSISSDRVVKKLSTTSTSSSSSFLLDIPDEKTIIATGALVLGSGIGAVLFLNTPKDEDGGTNNAAKRDSSSSSIPATPIVSVSRENRYSRTIFDRSSAASNSSNEGTLLRGQEQMQGRSSATGDTFGKKEKVASFGGEVRSSSSTYRSKPITDGYDTKAKSDAVSGLGRTIGPMFGGNNNSAGGKTTPIVTSVGGTGSGFTPSSSSFIGKTSTSPPGFGGVGQRSTSSVSVDAGIGERSGGGSMPIAKGKESNGGGVSPPFSSGTGSGFGGSGMKESTNKMASSSQFSGSGFGGGGMMKNQSSGFAAGSTGMPVKAMSASVPSNNIGVGAGFGDRRGGMPTMKGTESSGGVSPPFSSSTGSGFVKQSFTSQLTSGTTAYDNVNSFEGINKGSTGFSSSPQSPMSGGPSNLNVSKGVPGVGSSSNFLKGGVKSSTTTLDSKVSSPPGFGGVSKGVAGFGASSLKSLGNMKGEQKSVFGGSPFGGDKSRSTSAETKSSFPTGLSSVNKGVPDFGGGVKSSATTLGSEVSSPPGFGGVSKGVAGFGASPLKSLGNMKGEQKSAFSPFGGSVQTSSTTLDAKVSSPPGFGGISKGVAGFGTSSSGSLGTMKGEQNLKFGGSPFGSDKSSSASIETKSSPPTGLSGVDKGVSGFGGGLDSKVSSPPSFSGVSKGVAGFGASPLKSLGNMKGEQKSAFGGSPFGGDKSSSISKGLGGVKSSFAPLNSKITSPSGFGGVSKGVQGFATSSSGLLDAIKGEQTSAFGGSSSGGGVKSSFTSVETKLSSPTPPGFGEVSKGVTGFGTSSSGSLGTMKGEQKSVFGGFPFGGDKSRSTSAETKSSFPTGLSSVNKGVPGFVGSDNSRSTFAETKSSSPTPPGFGGVSKGVPSFGKSSSGSVPMKGEQKSVFGASPSTSFGGFGGETSSKSEGFSKGGIQSMPKSFGSDKLGSGFSNKASSLSGGFGANKSKFATMDMKSSSSSSSHPGFGGGSSLQSDSAGPSSATPNIMKGKQASLGGSSSPSFGTGGGMKNMPSSTFVDTKSSSATSLSGVSKGFSSFGGGKSSDITLESKVSPSFGGVSKGVPGFGMPSSGSLGVMKGEKSAFGASPSTTFTPKSFGSEKLGSGFTNEASATKDMESSSSYPGFGGGSSLQSDSAGPSSDTPSVMKGKQTTFSGSSSPSFGTGGMKNMPSLKMMPTPPAFDSDRSLTNDRDLFKSNSAFESSEPRASPTNNLRGIPPQSSNTVGRGGVMSGRGGPGRGAAEMGRGSIGGRGDVRFDIAGPSIGGSMLKGSQGRKQLQGYGAVPGTSIDSQMLGAFGSFGSKRSSPSSFRQPGSGYSKESLTAYQESMSTFRDMSSFREGSTPSPSPLLGNSDDDATNQIGERPDSMRRFRSGDHEKK